MLKKRFSFRGSPRGDRAAAFGRASIIASVIASATWLPQPSSAQPTALGDAFRVNSEIEGDQDAPSVAADAAGNFVVVFSDRNAPTAGIKGRRYAADGVAQGDVFPISANVGEADVAADAQGDFVVVWDFGDDGDDGGVFARRYDVTGAALGAAQQVNTTTAGTQVDPSVACAPNGACAVVWDTLSTGVFAQRYDVDGNAEGEELTLDADSSPQHFPDAAVDSDGNAVAIWNRFAEEPANSAVYGRLVPSNGALGDVSMVAVTGNEFATDPATLAVAAGNSIFAVVWNSAELGDPSSPTRPIPSDVYARLYGDALEPNGSRIAVTAEPSRRQHHAAVATLADGGFVVVWQNDATDSGTGENRVDNIAARQFDASGEPVGPIFLVNDEFAGSHRQPSVAADGTGKFVVVWYGSDGRGRGVFARQFAAAGTPVSPSPTPSASPTPTDTATAPPTRTPSSIPTSTPTIAQPTTTATMAVRTATPTTFLISDGNGCTVSPPAARGTSIANLLLIAAVLRLWRSRGSRQRPLAEISSP